MEIDEIVLLSSKESLIANIFSQTRKNSSLTENKVQVYFRSQETKKKYDTDLKIILYSTPSWDWINKLFEKNNAEENEADFLREIETWMLIKKNPRKHTRCKCWIKLILTFVYFI